MVCPLDTAAVTELWRLYLFSCTSPSFLCAGTLSPRGKCCSFFAGGLVGVDKHLFQRVSLIGDWSKSMGGGGVGRSRAGGGS